MLFRQICSSTRKQIWCLNAECRGSTIMEDTGSVCYTSSFLGPGSETTSQRRKHHSSRINVLPHLPPPTIWVSKKLFNKNNLFPSCQTFKRQETNLYITSCRRVQLSHLWFPKISPTLGEQTIWSVVLHRIQVSKYLLWTCYVSGSAGDCMALSPSLSRWDLDPLYSGNIKQD